MLRGNELAIFLKKVRINAGLTQKEVSKVLGYKSSQFVSNWERGLSSPPISTLRKLCTIYKASEEEMFSVVRDIAIRNLEEELRREFFEQDQDVAV